MMQARINYEFSSKLWKDASLGGWFFISLPHNLSIEIRESHQWQEEGWGRLKVTASIKENAWETAIWYDTKMNTYLLPVKSEIRKKAGIKLDDLISVSILI